jgi:hypothetical protein
MPVRRSPWLALALAAPVLAACGGDRGAAPKPARSYVLDESHASFRGVALGDAERRVVARFGPDQGEPDGPVGPVGEDRYDTGGPGTFASAPGPPRPDDRTKALRYRGMSFVTNERRVYVIMSSLPGTSRRVASGSATTSTVPAGPTEGCRAGTPPTRTAATPSRTASRGSTASATSTSAATRSARSPSRRSRSTEARRASPPGESQGSFHPCTSQRSPPSAARRSCASPSARTPRRDRTRSSSASARRTSTPPTWASARARRASGCPTCSRRSCPAGTWPAR